MVNRNLKFDVLGFQSSIFKFPLLISIFYFLTPAQGAIFAKASPEKHQPPKPKKIEFNTDPATGVQYYFVVHHKNGVKGADTDFAKIVMNYYNDKDSLIYDSHFRGGDSAGVMRRPIPLKKSFNGCLEQALLMMSPGDSAIFKIKADSIYIKSFHYTASQIPKFISASTYWTFHIRLIKFETMQQLKDERTKEIQKMKDELARRKTQEPIDINAYLQKNYPNVKPNADSLFILTKTPGAGMQIADGDSVEMAYKLYLLNDTLIEKSKQEKGGGFKFLYNSNTRLIKGWLDILPTLREGDEVKVLIPSFLAYGTRGGGQKIPPYTPLIFDMKVLSVKK